MQTAVLCDKHPHSVQAKQYELHYVHHRHYICLVDFLSGWPDGVEFAAGLPERPVSQQRHFLQAPKDVSVRGVLIHTAHSRFYDDALYKSTFNLLTDLLTYKRQQYMLINVITVRCHLV